ncbi:Uncharacterized protein dnm_064940 [Desulfonema magnum]|uniref:Uncharacterized protein n=1 Tax=Desulfonema magnum TaxID=45655 RepID=A0A975GRX5_9BACT|nr:Uncharacterized protein dnm_064940 [Desulfonema magnum]
MSLRCQDRHPESLCDGTPSEDLKGYEFMSGQTPGIFM